MKDQKLTSSFAEIFDFLDLTKTFTLVLSTDKGDKLELQVDGEMKKVGFEDYVSVDLVYGKNAAEYKFLLDKGAIRAQLGDILDIISLIIFCNNDLLWLSIHCAIDLPKLDTNIFFNLRGVEAMEILTQEQLVEAQNLLQNTNALKAPKAQRYFIFPFKNTLLINLKRQEAVEMKAEIQEQLNKFHQAFADIARGAYGASSTLQSLRYDFKFSKSRRARTMNQRATKNAAVFADIEKKLAAVKLSDEEVASFADLDYTCPLSGDSVTDIRNTLFVFNNYVFIFFDEDLKVMTGSHNDVMVFALRVSRPEHAIDAPTQVAINDILAGTYLSRI